MDNSLINIIRKIILQETIFLRHYIGKVAEIHDTDGKGRISVKIYDLGFNTNDIALWCYPRDKNSLSTPKIDDWVEVYFINGDKNRPVYMGIANEMKDMLPKNYDGKEKTHILFESPENKVHIKYDETQNVMEIGNSGFKESARKDDTTLSNITIDATFWTWLAAAAVVLAGLGVVAPTPTSLTSKINSGSSQIKIGDV